MSEIEDQYAELGHKILNLEKDMWAPWRKWGSYHDEVLQGHGRSGMGRAYDYMTAVDQGRITDPELIAMTRDFREKEAKRKEGEKKHDELEKLLRLPVRETGRRKK
jgi:hypothetical protein